MSEWLTDCIYAALAVSNGARWTCCSLWTCSCPSAQVSNERSRILSAQSYCIAVVSSEPSCSLIDFAVVSATTQEANYGHQQELDMIPLMMQKDYSPKGWLGLILGTRLWYHSHILLCCRSMFCLAPPFLRLCSATVCECGLCLIVYRSVQYAGMPCGTRRRTMLLLSSVG